MSTPLTGRRCSPVTPQLTLRARTKVSGGAVLEQETAGEAGVEQVGLLEQRRKRKALGVVRRLGDELVEVITLGQVGVAEVDFSAGDRAVELRPDTASRLLIEEIVGVEFDADLPQLAHLELVADHEIGVVQEGSAAEVAAAIDERLRAVDGVHQGGERGAGSSVEKGAHVGGL